MRQRRRLPRDRIEVSKWLDEMDRFMPVVATTSLSPSLSRGPGGGDSSRDSRRVGALPSLQPGVIIAIERRGLLSMWLPTTY